MTSAPRLLLALVLTACVAACGGGVTGGSTSQSVVVASANFPENVVLAEVYAAALEARGVDVSRELNIGSREVLLPALQRGDVTILPEYTGALLDYLTRGGSKATETAAQVREIRAALPPGLNILKPSTAQDQETITCTRAVVERYRLRSLADLAPVSGELVLGGPPELPRRKGFGLEGLRAVYGIEFKEFRPLDVAGPLTVSALRAGKIHCANLFSTQSAIAVNDFVPLADPEHLIASQAVVPLVADRAATPAVRAVLDRVSAALTTQALEQMVKQAEVDKAAPRAIAREFVREHGLG